MQLQNSEILLSEETKTRCAASFLGGAAAIWWFSVTTSGKAPTTWLTFKGAPSREFIPADYAKRGCDRLKKLKQFKSVSTYLAEFRNIILLMSEMSGDKTADRATHGLKHEIRMKVLKAHTKLFRGVC